MQYRPRARVAPRLSLISTAVMIVLALAAAGAIFVGFRVLFAPRPQISLGSPFDLVGRNRPLVVDVKDRAGLKSLRPTSMRSCGAFAFWPRDRPRLEPPRDRSAGAGRALSGRRPAPCSRLARSSVRGRGTAS